MRKFYPVAAGYPVEMMDPHRRTVKLTLDIIPFWPSSSAAVNWRLTVMMPETVAMTILLDGGVDVELDGSGEARFESGKLGNLKTMNLVAYYKGTNTKIERIWV